MTNEKKLHPSITKFKNFVSKHPKIMDEVKKGEHTLQDMFEDWYLLGEEDPYWKNFRSEEAVEPEKVEQVETTSSSTGAWSKYLGSALQNLDANQMQYHVQNISQAITAVQGVISQFSNGSSTSLGSASTSKSPFSFKKD